jgi:hypothetical protein
VPNILRKRAAAQKAGVGRTKFDDDFVLKNNSDPFVPNTNDKVRRVRPVALGDRAIGFFDDELDVLIEGLRQWRDSKPMLRKEPEQLRTGRVAWRERTNKSGEAKPV